MRLIKSFNIKEKDLIIFSYLILDKEMLVLVVNHLNQLVSDPPQPEERGDVVEVAQLLVEPGDGVVGEADVGADTVGSEQRKRITNS